MPGDHERAGKFDAIRARAARMRIHSLQARLNSVSLLCDLAGRANATIAAEALERARTAFERIQQELTGSDLITKHSGELTPRVAEIEAELARALRRLRIVRGEEQGERQGNGSGKELAS